MKYTIGDHVKVANLYFLNQTGGTENLTGDLFEVEIEKEWYDYEIGQRYTGVLIHVNDIEKARKVGTSKFTPEHYKQYGEHMYLDVKKAHENFRPEVVFFGDCDIREERD